MHSTLFSPSSQSQSNPPPSSSIDAASKGGCAASAVTGVGLHRLSRVELRELSDSALEVYIRACVKLQNQAQARFSSADGTFADAAERDQWLLAEHEARDHQTVRAELARRTGDFL